MHLIGACPVFLENLDHHLNMCMLSLPMRKEDTEGLAGQHVGKRPLEFSSRLKSFKNHGKMSRLPSKGRVPGTKSGWSPDGPPGQSCFARPSYSAVMRCFSHRASSSCARPSELRWHSSSARCCASRTTASSDSSADITLAQASRTWSEQRTTQLYTAKSSEPINTNNIPIICFNLFRSVSRTSWIIVSSLELV